MRFRWQTLAALVEKKLCDCLRNDRIPDNQLVEMVAVLKASSGVLSKWPWKVKAIETSISACFKLKQELGSYALMGASFESSCDMKLARWHRFREAGLPAVLQVCRRCGAVGPCA